MEHTVQASTAKLRKRDRCQFARLFLCGSQLAFRRCKNSMVDLVAVV